MSYLRSIKAFYKFMQNHSGGTKLSITAMTFPFGAAATTLGITQVWILSRDYYCRAFHETAHALCHLIGSDFRPDIVLVLIGSLLLYTVAHFWKLRRLSLRAHLVVAFSTILFCVGTYVIRFLLPGPLEAWLAK